MLYLGPSNDAKDIATRDEVSGALPLLYGSADPDNGGGVDGQTYYQNNGKIWTKQAGVWVFTGIQYVPKSDYGFNAGAWQAPLFTSRNSTLCLWTPPGNATTVPGVLGFPALTGSGNVTARNVATTNALTRRKRLSYVTPATAASLCGLRQQTTQITLGTGTLGGFFIQIPFGCSDALAVSGPRQFIGVRNSGVAPTNVEPSTITNCIGVGAGAANSNLFLYYGGSAAQTPIDLGADFPANTLSADSYILSIYAPQDPVAAGFKVGWHVEREGTAFSAAGTLNGTSGTQLPASTTLLALNCFRTNNADSLAVGLDFGQISLCIPDA